MTCRQAWGGEASRQRTAEGETTLIFRVQRITFEMDYSGLLRITPDYPGLQPAAYSGLPKSFPPRAQPSTSQEQGEEGEFARAPGDTALAGVARVLEVLPISQADPSR